MLESVRCSDSAGRGGSRSFYIRIEDAKEEKKTERMGREKGEKSSGGMEEGGQVSTTLYLPRKNVERTKQMNRREEGMITTRMIIFNQNHDNNNK